MSKNHFDFYFFFSFFPFFLSNRDNCPAVAQQTMQHHHQPTLPPTFSPILSRSAAMPQQQQQQHFYQQHHHQHGSSNHHHYQQQTPTEEGRQHAEGSHSWNEWTQQLLVTTINASRPPFKWRLIHCHVSPTRSLVASRFFLNVLSSLGNTFTAKKRRRKGSLTTRCLIQMFIIL